MAPRMYYATDANFTSSAGVEVLGEAHGPAGPMVVISLLGMAKMQGAGGEAKTTAKKLAADAYLLGGPEEARAVVETAIGIGTLEAVELDERTIHVKFPRWRDWQPRMAAAERAARAREGKRDEASEPADVR